MESKRTKALEGRGLPLFLIGGGALILWLSWLLGYMGDVNDSYVFQYIGRAMTRGQTPYLDTFDHKGPLLYLINAMAASLSEYTGGGVWILQLPFLLADFIGLYRLFRLRLGRGLSCAGLLLSAGALFRYTQGHGNLTESYALPFILLALYIFADYFLNQRISRLRLILCGLSFGAVCLLRANMIAVWAVMCVGILAELIREKKYKELFSYLGYFLLGVGILLLPVLLWLGMRGALPAFYHQYIEFNLLYSAHNGEFTKAKAFLYFLANPLVMLAAALSVYYAIKGRRLFDILSVLYLFISLASVSMSGRILRHYGIILAPALVYPFTLLLADLSRERDKKSLRAVLFCFGAAFAVCSWALTGAAGLRRAYVAVQGKGISPEIRQVADCVIEHTEPEDPITVYGVWDVIYNLSERLSASKYSYQYPIGDIDPKIYEEYFKELSENPPKVIVIRKDASSARERMYAFIEEEGYEEILRTENGEVYKKH